jgi:hypothetical protein
MHFHACFSDTHAVFGIATDVTLLRAETIKERRRHFFFDAECLGMHGNLDIGPVQEHSSSASVKCVVLMVRHE